ncbi:MAG: ATP synthase F1 subunit epsilon [Selenomonadaceae bacterium]
MATMKLQVISPDAVVYEADIAMLVADATSGPIGILPMHLPMITGIVPCAMRLKMEDGTQQYLAVAGGFMEVQRDKITVLASCAERPEQIDRNRAEQSLARAKERIKTFQRGTKEAESIDIKRAELSLQRALARLKSMEKI